jgi:hypothetical protein
VRQLHHERRRRRRYDLSIHATIEGHAVMARLAIKARAKERDAFGRLRQACAA